MATESEIHVWLSGYPRAWNQLCQALMWQLAAEFGTVVSTPPSAIDAYRTEAAAGRIRQGTPPPGTFVYFDIGADGHVGFVMNSGRVLMATSHLAEEWVSTDAGWNTVQAYAAAVGATVLGWSTLNGGNSVPFAADSGTAGGGSTPLPEDETEEIAMTLRQAHYDDGGKLQRMLFSEESGYCTLWSSGTSSDIANAMSRNWGTGPSVEISAALAGQMQSDLAATRAGKA